MLTVAVGAPAPFSSIVSRFPRWIVQEVAAVRLPGPICITERMRKIQDHYHTLARRPQTTWGRACIQTDHYSCEITVVAAAIPRAPSASCFVDRGGERGGRGGRR